MNTQILEQAQLARMATRKLAFHLHLLTSPFECLPWVHLGLAEPFINSFLQIFVVFAAKVLLLFCDADTQALFFMAPAICIGIVKSQWCTAGHHLSLSSSLDACALSPTPPAFVSPSFPPHLILSPSSLTLRATVWNLDASTMYLLMTNLKTETAWVRIRVIQPEDSSWVEASFCLWASSEVECNEPFCSEKAPFFLLSLPWVYLAPCGWSNQQLPAPVLDQPAKGPRLSKVCSSNSVWS